MNIIGHVPNKGQRVGKLIGQGFETAGNIAGNYLQQQGSKEAQIRQMQGENEAIKREFGVDLSGVTNPKIREKYLEQLTGQKNERQLQEEKYGFEEGLAGTKGGVDTATGINIGNQKHLHDLELQEQKFNLEGKQKKSKEDQERQAKLKPFQGALKTLEAMRNIRQRGNLGLGTKLWSNFPGETSKDKGQYEQLGKSLIQYASNIPIRNQAEFDALAHSLYDSEMTDKEAEGVLDAMQQVIEQSLAEVQSEIEGNPETFQEASEGGKVLDVDTLRSISKQAKGNKDKAKQIARKMGYKVE